MNSGHCSRLKVLLSHHLQKALSLYKASELNTTKFKEWLYSSNYSHLIDMSAGMCKTNQKCSSEWFENCDLSVIKNLIRSRLYELSLIRIRELSEKSKVNFSALLIVWTTIVALQWKNINVSSH